MKERRERNGSRHWGEIYIMEKNPHYYMQDSKGQTLDDTVNTIEKEEE